MTRQFAALVLVMAALLLALPASAQRPYYMGFSPWPPDFTPEAVQSAYRFIAEHGDIIAHHFDAGIPWPEALENREFSEHLRENWRTRKENTPRGHAVYVAITPLNFGRDGLAVYWGKSDNQGLPRDWKKKKLRDEEVRRAYLNYARRVIEFFQPDFLAIAIEANILITKKTDMWRDFVELNRYVYTELKRSHPRLPIFATIQYEHLRGIEDAAKKNLGRQMPGVRELMSHSDLAALSTYHFATFHNPPRDDYFAPAQELGKRIAIAESGAVSRDLQIFKMNLPGNQDDQKAFLGFMLQKAAEMRFAFVINFITIDYDRMLPKLPKSIREVAKAWAYTGLQESDGRPKAALQVWEVYRRARRTG